MLQVTNKTITFVLIFIRKHYTYTLMNLKHYTLTIGLLCLCNWAIAQFISQNHGTWISPSTWVNGLVPSTNDAVIIRHKVSTFATQHNANITIDNSGELTTTNPLAFSGNSFTNRGFLIGPFRFAGFAAQTWDGDAPLLINSNYTAQIFIDNPQGVTITGNNQNAAILNFVNGKLTLGAYDFTVNTRINNASATNYIVTGTNSGSLRINMVMDMAILFPVGTATSYNPACLNLNGMGMAGFRVKVSDFPNSADVADRLNKYWQIDRLTNSSLTATLKVCWNTENEGTNFNRNANAIAIQNTANWNTVAATPATSGGHQFCQTRSGIASATFGAGVYSGAILPVELLAFKGFEKGLMNEFRWTTSREENSLRHVLTRWDKESNRWIDIKSIEAQGTTNDAHNYSAMDENPLSESYYRIRFEDSDRAVSYSKTIVIQRKADLLGQLAPYPNPFEGAISFDYKLPKNINESTLVLVDGLGRTVLTETLLQNQSQISFDWSALPRGVYFVRLLQDNQISVTQKIVKQL